MDNKLIYFKTQGPSSSHMYVHEHMIILVLNCATQNSNLVFLEKVHQ
jgi:hypothetical protein